MSDELKEKEFEEAGLFLFPSVLPPQFHTESHSKLNLNGAEKSLSGFSSFSLHTDESEQKPRKEPLLANIDKNFTCKSGDRAIPKLDAECISSRSSEEDKCEKQEEKRKEKKKQKKKLKKKNRWKEKEKAMVKLFDKTKPDTIWLDDACLKTADAFRVDRRKDKDNLQFDTLYRLDVANYKRKADIACLGLKKNQSFEWNDERSKKKRIKRSSKESRYFNAEIGQTFDVLTVNLEGFPDFEGESEHLIDLKKNDKNGSNDKGNENDCICNERYVAERTEYYNEHLRKHPNDIEKWIDFARMQGESFMDTRQSMMSSTFDPQKYPASNHKAITEKKVSILEKALSSNRDSVHLILEYMECCKEILDPAAVHKKWSQFTVSHLNKGLLWQKYLQYVQSDLSSFSVSNVIAIYGRCFQTMSRLWEGAIKTFSPEKDHCENMLAILAQFCLFLWQSDFPEKTIANLQAMVELNCFVPKDIESLPGSSQKAFFEAFWDSDVLRFGEANAAGWGSWMLLQNKSMDPESSPPKHDVINIKLSLEDYTDVLGETVSPSLPKSKNWLNIERQRQRNNWTPVKQGTTEGESCEDPDRFVLADDILPFLFKTQTEEHMKSLLLLHLAFLGVPIKTYFLGSFLCQRIVGAGVLPVRMKVFSCDDTEDFVCLSRTDKFGLSETIIHCSNASISYIDEVFSQSLQLAISRGSRSFVNLISHCWFLFKVMLLKVIFEDEKAHQMRTEVKRVRKFAKTLLKLQSNRNCFELWQIFARFEYDFGLRDEAFRVFDMVIWMCVEEQGKGTIFNRNANVFRRYVKFLLRAFSTDAERRDELENRIVNVLLLLSGEARAQTNTMTTSKPNPLRIRRIKEACKEQFARLIDESASDLVSQSAAKRTKVFAEGEFNWLLCFALLIFFVDGFNSAENVLDEIEKNARLNHMQVLEVAKTKLDLHEFRSFEQPTKIPDLRNEVWRTVSRFPEETNFNETLLCLENTGLASLKIRRHHHKVLGRESSLRSWMHAIHYEENRLENLETFTGMERMEFSATLKDTLQTILPNTGIVNRLRGLYNRATSSRECRCCVALWRRFLKFESKYGDSRRAKNVFYTALQSCPWSKDLYSDAISIIGDAFEDVIDVMNEKEIRIRLPTEELEILLEEVK